MVVVPFEELKFLELCANMGSRLAEGLKESAQAVGHNLTDAKSIAVGQTCAFEKSEERTQKVEYPP